MQERLEINDPAVVKLMLDPTRHSLLNLLTEGAYTASQLAEVLGTSAPRLSYHLKALEKAGLIELVETRQKGNLIEKYFQAVAKQIQVANAAALGGSPVDFAPSLMELIRSVLAEIGRQAALPSDERLPGRASLGQLRADEAGLAELETIFAEVRAQLTKVKDRAPGVRYNLVLMLAPVHQPPPTPSEEE